LKVLNGNNWKALLLLSIVVPVSLLTSFKLTGFLGEPATIKETITLEPVTWEYERPNQTVHLDNLLESSYSNNKILATMYLLIGEYAEDDSALVSDFITIRVKMNLTGADSDFSIENVYLIFRDIYKGSRLFFQRTNTDFQCINLSLVKIVDGINGENNLKASINLAGLNHPNDVYLQWNTIWTLHSLNTQDHELSATYEVTYYNGTAYNKIVQPFQIRIKG
jgi:hypothetical protein